MLVYRILIPGVVDTPKQAQSLGIYKDIEVLRIPNLNYIRNDYLPFGMEMEDKFFNYVSFVEMGEITTYLDEPVGDVLTETKVFTEVEMEVLVRLKKHITVLLLKNHYEKLINFSLIELNVERTTWERQKTEADEYLKDNNSTSISFITKLAEVRGTELSDLVNKIKAKSDIYADQVATLLGQQHNIETEIELLEDITKLGEIENIPTSCI